MPDLDGLLPPKFQWGQPVKAAVDLYNDGSYPDHPADALLVKTGDLGEVVKIGTYTDDTTNTHTPLYLVEFDNRLVVGCLEQEIEPQD